MSTSYNIPCNTTLAAIRRLRVPHPPKSMPDNAMRERGLEPLSLSAPDPKSTPAPLIEGAQQGGERTEAHEKDAFRTLHVTPRITRAEPVPSLHNWLFAGGCIPTLLL